MIFLLACEEMGINDLLAPSHPNLPSVVDKRQQIKAMKGRGGEGISFLPNAPAVQNLITRTLIGATAK